MINSKGINLRIDNPMESTQTISQFLPGEWRRNQLGNRPVINSPISISSWCVENAPGRENTGRRN